MENLSEKAIGISNKFPFSEFKTSASAVNEEGDPTFEASSCKNHLDTDFMSLLEKGAHLDTNLLPL